MSESSVSMGRVGVVGAVLGAFAAVLAVKLQRPANICLDAESIEGLAGGLCTIMYVQPLPLWAWLLAGSVGALVGYLIAVVGLKTVQRLT